MLWNCPLNHTLYVVRALASPEAIHIWRLEANLPLAISTETEEASMEDVAWQPESFEGCQTCSKKLFTCVQHTYQNC